MSQRVGRGRSCPELGDVLDAYLGDLAVRSKPETLKAATSACRRLRADLPRSVAGITLEAVKLWRQRRAATGASNRTANKQTGVLRAALSYAVELGWLVENPLKGLRRLPTHGSFRRRIARALPDPDVCRLLAAAADIDRESPRRFPREPLLRALFLTGCRWWELASAVWADFDETRGVLYLRATITKTGESRPVPIEPALVAAIVALRAHHVRMRSTPTPSARIFLSATGKPWSQNTGNFHRFLSEAMRRASIPHRDGAGKVFHVHATRRTFLTRCARHGVPLQVAAKLTGIRTVQVVVDHYADLDVDDQRNGLRLLPPMG